MSRHASRKSYSPDHRRLRRIGYEFAHLFAHDKYNLVLVARSGPRLAELAEQLRQQHGIAVKCIPLDLGLPQASQTLFEKRSEPAFTSMCW